MIGSGKRIVNLYVLDVADTSAAAPVSSSSFTNNVVDASIWHQHFGHSSFERIELLSDVLGFSKTKNK